jgi:tol-pal system protein YbgF
MKQLICISLAAAALLAGCAARSDILVLDERVADLESKVNRQQKVIQQVGRSTESKEMNLRNQSASLRVQLDAVREEVQILRGKLEEMEFLLQRERKQVGESDKLAKVQLDRLQQDLQAANSRIAQLERYLDLSSAAVVGSGREGKPAAPAKTGGKALTENEIYLLAKQAFDKGEYDSAREGFQELIKRYPDSKNADNAQFWIGEIYYREKWYEKAIVEYQKVIESYPKGNKVRSALLKQGYAFANIGDTANASLILKDLIRRYPDSNEATIAKRKLKQLK